MGHKIFLDTEFIDTGSELILVSIGLERDDGARYYAEPREANLSQASDWVHDHVIVYTDSWIDAMKIEDVDLAHKRWLEVTTPRAQIASEIVAFVGEEPTFYAYYDHYDWVLLSQIYGPLTERPDGWPMRCIDLADRAWLVGLDPEEVLPHENSLPGFDQFKDTHAHRADAGAAWNHELYRELIRMPAVDIDYARVLCFENP